MVLQAVRSIGGGRRGRIFIVVWTLSIALSSHPIFASEGTGVDQQRVEAGVPAIGCSQQIAGGPDRNDPTLIPQLPWNQVYSVGFLSEASPDHFLLRNEHFYIDTRDLPINWQNMVAVYRAGGKLYQHFDRFDSVTGEVETHRWEFPYYRGVNRMSDFRKKLADSHLVRKLQKVVYPHRIPDPVNKRTLLLDEKRPAYEIRFNYEPEEVIRRCAHSERILQNTTTKVAVKDASGKSVLTTATWLSDDVQNGFLDMLYQGRGYTIGLYTTEHHPHEIAMGTNGGYLAAGAIGIHVDGVVTGLSLFMDRSHPPGKDHALYYDSAGRLVFFAELDYLEWLGLPWVDSVTVNRAAREFGGEFVDRAEFHRMMDVQHLNPQPFKFPDSGTWNVRFARWDKAALLAEIQGQP